MTSPPTRRSRRTGDFAPREEAGSASEILKSRPHRGLRPSLSFFRDRKGAEVDVANDFLAGLESLAGMVGAPGPRRKVRGFVVYGGGEAQRRSAATIVPWARLDRCEWWEPGSRT